MELVPPESLLGQSVDQFRLDEFIGGGTHCLVYKAFDTVLHRTVAIKLIPGKGVEPLSDKDRVRIEEARSRLMREAKAAGCLSHPNIVTIHTCGLKDETPYICMEFIDGRTLTQILNDRGVLSIHEAAGIFEQVLMAIDVANRQQVVHRDIKPGNIMVTDEGLVKVMDFGIAKMPSFSMAKTGTVTGTPYYMSPEQITGQEVDIRSDIFSLGAVLYEVLTGERPFEADNTATLAYKIVQMEPIPPDVQNIHIPRSYANIIRKALAKHPSERFQNPMEMLLALRTAKAEGDAPVRGKLECMVSEDAEGSGGPAADAPVAVDDGGMDSWEVRAESSSRGVWPPVSAGSESSRGHGPLVDSEREPLPSWATVFQHDHAAGTRKGFWRRTPGYLMLLAMMAGAFFGWQYSREPEDISPRPSAGIGEGAPAGVPASAELPGSPGAIKQVESWVAEAKESLENDPARAQYLLEKAVALDPHDFEAQFLLGKLLHSKKDYHGAVRRYEEALRVNSRSADVHSNLGFAYLTMGDYDAAIRSYESSLELKPAYLDEVLTNLAVCYVKKNDPERAWSLFNKALTVNPENPLAHKYLLEAGRIPTTQKAYPPSPETGARGIQEDRQVSTAASLPQESPVSQRAQSAVDLLVAQAKGMFETDPENARKLLEEAILIDPLHFDALFQLGRLLTFRKDLKQAIEHYEKALEINDKAPDVFFNLGYVHMILKDYDSAIVNYEACRALSPPYQDEVLTNLGISHLKKNNLKQAELLFQEAMQLNPGNRIAGNYLKSLARTKKGKL